MLIPIREFENRGVGTTRPEFVCVGVRWVRASEVRSIRTFDADAHPQFYKFSRVEIAGPVGTNYEFWSDDHPADIEKKIRMEK